MSFENNTSRDMNLDNGVDVHKLHSLALQQGEQIQALSDALIQKEKSFVHEVKRREELEAELHAVQTRVTQTLDAQSAHLMDQFRRDLDATVHQKEQEIRALEHAASVEKSRQLVVSTASGQDALMQEKKLSEALKRQLDERNSQLQNAREQITELCTRLQVADTKSNAVIARVVHQSTMHDNLQVASLEVAQNQIKSLYERLRAAEVEAAAKDADIKRLRDQLPIFERDIAVTKRELRDTRHTLEIKEQEFNQERTAMLVTAQDLGMKSSETVRFWEKRVSDLSLERDSFQTALIEHQRMVSEIKAGLVERERRVEAEVNKMIETVGAKDREITSLREAIATLEARMLVEDKSAEISMLRESDSSTRMKLSAALQELETIKIENTMLTKTRIDYDAARSELSSQRALIERLSRLLGTAGIDASVAYLDLERQNASLAAMSLAKPHPGFPITNTNYTIDTTTKFNSSSKLSSPMRPQSASNIGGAVVIDSGMSAPMVPIGPIGAGILPFGSGVSVLEQGNPFVTHSSPGKSHANMKRYFDFFANSNVQNGQTVKPTTSNIFKSFDDALNKLESSDPLQLHKLGFRAATSNTLNAMKSNINLTASKVKSNNKLDSSDIDEIPSSPSSKVPGLPFHSYTSNKGDITSRSNRSNNGANDNFGGNSSSLSKKRSKKKNDDPFALSMSQSPLSNDDLNAFGGGGGGGGFGSDPFSKIFPNDIFNDNSSNKNQQQQNLVSSQAQHIASELFSVESGFGLSNRTKREPGASILPLDGSAKNRRASSAISVQSNGGSIQQIPPSIVKIPTPTSAKQAKFSENLRDDSARLVKPSFEDAFSPHSPNLNDSSKFNFPSPSPSALSITSRNADKTLRSAFPDHQQPGSILNSSMNPHKLKPVDFGINQEGEIEVGPNGQLYFVETCRFRCQNKKCPSRKSSPIRPASPPPIPPPKQQEYLVIPSLGHAPAAQVRVIQDYLDVEENNARKKIFEDNSRPTSSQPPFPDSFPSYSVDRPDPNPTFGFASKPISNAL